MGLRIRTVKPEAWSDPRVGRLSPAARLLWVVLLTMSDDDGRFIALPTAIGAHGYLHDADGAAAVPGLLDELNAAGLLVLYEVDGVPYGWHPKWSKHQKISHPTPGCLPAPESGSRIAPEALRSASSESGEASGWDRKGGDRRGEDRPRESADESSVVVDVLTKLREAPEWAQEIDSGADVSISALVTSNTDAPWLELAGEAVASKLDPSPTSIRTNSPRQGLELRLHDHRSGRREGTGRVTPLHPPSGKAQGDLSRFAPEASA